MSEQTWIVYRASSPGAQGWEDRKIMPSGNGTDILWENWSSSGRLPSVGSRIQDFQSDELTGHITDAKDGDWIVDRVDQFATGSTDLRIVVCWCSYQPVESQWQNLRRGRPVHELLDSHLQPSP